MRKILGLLVMLTMVFVLAACGNDNTPEENNDGNNTGDTNASIGEDGEVFTLEELEKYDGQDGNKAYVAIDGVVYDVTDVDAWADGVHLPAGGLLAGEEHADNIAISPHGESVLEDLPVVGTVE